MATFKTADYTNFTASPVTLPPVGRWGGKVRTMTGTHEVTTAYTTSDILLLFRVPWDVRPLQFWIGWDDINDSTLPFDVGLYYADGVPTVYDADEFASALAGGTATVMTNQIFEAAATDIDRQGKKLWEWAGETSRPTAYNSMVDVGITFGTNGGNTAAGTISWNFLYTID